MARDYITGTWALIGAVIATAALSDIPKLTAQQSQGIWISPSELAQRPMSGAAWTKLNNEASQSCGQPDLEDGYDPANVCILAKALVFARTGAESLRGDVHTALSSVVSLYSHSYTATALYLGRELGAYVLAADLIDLRGHDPVLDAEFRDTLRFLRTAPAGGGGVKNLVECHEKRPNNWGTHCGASRAAVAAYLGESAELARVAQVLKGWLGDRSSYAGFSYGELWWQADPSALVGINPSGAIRDGHSIDGVLPDDQRRSGAFVWPPPKENYVYEALQGALLQAILLRRAGYDAFDWQDQALLRAFNWLHNQADFPAEGDDTWQPHVMNFFYGTSFPAPVPARPGKGFGWTDWVYGTGTASPLSPTAVSNIRLISAIMPPVSAVQRAGPR